MEYRSCNKSAGAIYYGTCDAISTYNGILSTDQKIKTRDKYHTVDTAIRHKMSTISSADGQG